MLNEEVAKYRELSGDTNPNVPISRIGGYLDGYEKALEQQPCEDAISRSDMLDAVGHGTTYTSEELQIIIKGLPSVNPQPCEDAISRQEVLYLVGDYDLSMGQVVKGIHALPPVNPQPKTGHWIAQDIHNCHTDFKCSECGYIHSFMHLYGKPTADYTYCPNCGTKMIEPQEREVQDADSD